MPTRYRSALRERCGGKMVLTIDTEQACLLLYTHDEWLGIEAKLVSLPNFNPQARWIQRLLLGHATVIDLDSSDRLLLPPELREHAGLEKKLALVGQGNKFEIWSEPRWQTERRQWLEQGLIKGDDLPDELQKLSL